MSELGMLATVAPKTWTDHLGRTWRTPTIRGRLKCGKTLGYAALRAYVFHRDAYTCQWCGVRSSVEHEGFLGGPAWCLVPDHVISRRNGGAHHPANLQTLCGSCNAKKVGLVDARHPIGAP